MIASLRQAKAEFSSMVKRASHGEDVLITVHGKAVAKLIGIPQSPNGIEKKKWLQSLRILRGKTATGIRGKTIEQLINEDRDSR